jgi:hypothetical protein
MALLRATLLTLACGLSLCEAHHTHEVPENGEALRTASKKVAIIGELPSIPIYLVKSEAL